MSCTDPDPPPPATGALVSAEITPLLAPQRPQDYLCCGHRSEFGCQAGKTPDNATGSLPDVAPFDSISGWPGDWVWQVAGIQVPYTLLTRTGDVTSLAQLWPYMSSLMAFIDRAAASAGGLIAFGPYADWLGPEKVSDSFAENFYLSRAATHMAEMAAALGLPAEAAAYTAMAAAVGDAMAAALFDSGSGTWDHGSPPNQHAQAMALAVGLAGAVTANASATITAAMVADVNAHGAHPTGGLASTRWILQGLATGNQPALALAMATVPTSPSWAFMTTPGMPGTIWEEWSGDAHHSDGSKNHPMFAGGIGVWLYESALGLRFAYGVEPVDEPADSAAAAAASAALAASGLGADPRLRAGLTHAQAAAAAAAAAEMRGVVPPATGRLPALRARLAELGVRRTARLAPPRAPLAAIFTAAPNGDLVRALGEAAGWHDTPQGRCELAWAWQPAGRVFHSSMGVPSGVLGRHALPLDLVRDAAEHSACSRARVAVIADAGGVALDADVRLLRDNGDRGC